MDLAANDLEKTSAVKQKSMVSKLHNMQWLKNTSYSTSPIKVKTLCKQRRSHDEDNKVEDTIFAIEDSKTNLSEDSCEYHLTMNTCIKDLSNDSMAESDRNLWNKDENTSDVLLNTHVVIMQNGEEVKVSESMAVQENLVATQLENQCHVDEGKKDQVNVLQNILEDKAQNVTCSNVSELQKINHNIKEPDLVEHSDKNNNNAKCTTLDMSVANTSEPSEDDKASTGTKDKDVCIKKILTAQKTNVKNASNTTLSKCCNDKSSAPFTNPKKSLSNLSKSPIISTDKCGKFERVNNKNVLPKKNACTKDESVKQQHTVPTKGVENKAKDTAVYLPAKSSGQSKADLEKEPNKMADTNRNDPKMMIRNDQNDQKAQSSSCAVPSNKDKTLQVQQRTAAKQLTSKFKGQDTGGCSRSNTSSPLNRLVDKNKVPEKTEKVNKSSDPSLCEFEKNNDKNVSSDQKPYVANRGTTFVVQYKNSTLSKPVKTKSGNVGYAAASGRNPLYARNSITPDKERAGNVEHRAVTKMKKDCLPSDTSSNSNTKTEDLRASTKEADAKQKCETVAQPASAKSMDAHETAMSVLNNKNNANLTEDIKPANMEKHAKLLSVTSEQTCKKEKTIDNVKVDVDQPLTNVGNERIKPSKDSFGVRLNKSYAGPQTYPMSQHIFKSEDTQQDASQMRNNPIIWNNFSESTQRNGTLMSVQPQQPGMHSQQTIIQAENYMRQASLRGEMDCRFYEQRLPMNDTMVRLSQIPNTFDATTPYAEYSVQATSSNGNDGPTAVYDTMSGNRGSPNVPHRYTPNVQQRPFTPLSDYSGQPVPVGQISRWNVSLQDGFHIEQFAPNTTQPGTMHVYNVAAFSPDDFNGAQMPAANCLPPHHPLFYAPCMQTWNPQLHYPTTPMFHGSPCAGYTMLPNVAGQSSNYGDVAPMSACMHDQPQHRYIHYVPASNSSAMQMHAANPTGYAKGMYNCDLSNCAVETKNTAVDDVPARPNRYYKRYQDNCRSTYEVPQYATPPPPISRSQQQQQQPFVPAAVNQYNVYGPPSQKYYKQNTMSFAQPLPRSPKDQRTQDFVCEDTSQEDIPPIISPKEFMTNNVNLPNKSEQFAPRMFKSDFRVRSNTGYRQASFHRYNGGFRRNAACQDFPKEYGSSIGRGITKAIQNTKI